MIRPASINDIPRLVEMGRLFFDETAIAAFATFAGESCSRTLNELIDGENGAVFVAEENEVVGAIGGMVYPLFFNVDHLTGQEFFWWCEPEYRKGAGRKLFEALESWAQERGARSFTMIALESNRPDAVAAVYKRAGYRPSERSFIRGL